MIEGAVNLRDLEAIAASRLDPAIFAYFASGAGDEDTLRANEAAFARRVLRPRVLVDVERLDLATSLLGTPVLLPVGIAPTARHGLAHPEAEVATARAAAAAGALFCSATLATRSMEEVAAVPPGPRWFQLYTHADRAISVDLVARAGAAGFRALVVTVDLPVVGRRDRELRTEYLWPGAEEYGNLLGYPDQPAVSAGLHRAVGTWDDLPGLREGAPALPLVLKGILTPEDAVLAVEHGAAGVWVSNHGGRQLDRVPATIDVLEEIVAAVDGRAEVYVDGGVRRATDVLTALALGARAVFIGRPVVYGLAIAGEQGVADVLGMLRTELEVAMALLGTPTLADVTRDRVV